MIEIRFQSIATWEYEPTPRLERRSRSTFKAPWHSTLELLERELNHLRAKNVVIACFLQPYEIRIDGWPRSNANMPSHPGVALHFDSRRGHLRYASDTHDFWQHNVRGIGLGLQALRAVDRYGITRGGEQYRGFAQLPAGSIALGGGMTRESAAQFIAEHSSPSEADEDAFGWAAIAESPEIRERCYRRAAKRLHPDAGGDPDLFQKLQDAKRILG